MNFFEKAETFKLFVWMGSLTLAPETLVRIRPQFHNFALSESHLHSILGAEREQ